MSEASVAKNEYAYGSSAASCAHAYLLQPLRQVIRNLRLGGKALDMGCGNGSLSHELRKLGLDVYGVDSSESGIRIARAAFPHMEFLVCDVEQDLFPKPFAIGSFDLVITTEVVEHVYNPRRFVENAFQLLRPSGYLIVSTPYHGYAKNLMLALTGRMDAHFTALWDGGHIKFWSRHTLSRLLEEKGFVDLKFLGAGRVPFLWKSMILVARKPIQK